MVEKLFQLENEKKLWEFFYKEIPLWSYLRGNFYGQFLPYNPNLKFSSEDLKGFIIFLTLLWKKDLVVIFVTSRKDLVDYSHLVANAKYPLSEKLIFTRSENGAKGNVFILESIRFLFRKFCWVFCWFSYNKKNKELNETGLNFDKNMLKNLIGDYYFNYFLNIFLNNTKAIIYSNAVIPRTERYSSLYNSFEIQHGVIHKEHLDYVNVPYVSNKLICYSEKIKDNLSRWGFSGHVEVCAKETSTLSYNYNVLIFGTVSTVYSEFVERLCGELKSLNIDFKVKLHPRDLYNYSRNVFENCVKEASPLEAIYPVMPDTSLISDCFLNGKKFIYFSVDGVNKTYINNCLLEKYNVYSDFEQNFDICVDVREVLRVLEKFNEN